jgi:hypothetical protein
LCAGSATSGTASVIVRHEDDAAPPTSQWLEIARFTYWWQAITVYVLYMVPLSVIFRRLPWWQQYLYGLFPMGLLEFGGYALHTSYAYPHNWIDRLFSERNFSLAMVLFFAAYFPCSTPW